MDDELGHDGWISSIDNELGDDGWILVSLNKDHLQVSKKSQVLLELWIVACNTLVLEVILASNKSCLKSGL
jgi:hypothetical protein